MGASFGNCSFVVVPLVLTLHETGYDIMAVTTYVVPPTFTAYNHERTPHYGYVEPSCYYTRTLAQKR